MVRMRRVFIAALVVVSALLASRFDVARADSQFSSSGPFTRVKLSPTLNCAASWVEDASPLFFSDTACGTYLSHNGTLYGPSSTPGGDSFLPGIVPFTPVSQSLTGNGTAANPYVITTVVDAGQAFQLTQRDSYVKGDSFISTAINVGYAGGGSASPVLFHAADCSVQNSDTGLGFVDASTKTAGCQGAARTLKFVPTTVNGAHYVSTTSALLWGAVASKTNFSDSCTCNQTIDNAAGLSWGLSIPQGGDGAVSFKTVMSSTTIGAINPPPTFVAPTKPYNAVLSVPVATNQSLTFRATDASNVTLTVEPDPALLNVQQNLTSGATANAVVGFVVPVAGDYPIVVRASDGSDETVTRVIVRGTGKAPTALEAHAATIALPQIGPKSVYLSVSATMRSLGRPVGGKQVVFRSTNGQEMCRTYTDLDGYASCKSLVSAVQALTGLDYAVSFDGDALYLPSTGKGDIIKLMGLPLP